MPAANSKYNRMENPRAMTLKRLTQAVLTTWLLALTLMLTPSAMAVSFSATLNSGDESEGDVLGTDCGNLESGLGSALGCDNEDEILDFTTFTGELDGPDASGYDSALTQSSSAREVIQTIVNFALSFLGLVATIMIIYGGVLYVTSGGEEDATSKGKKVIMYAAIGIVIILASFALVNTLLNATGGNSGRSGGAGSGATISEAGEAFDVDAVLDELEDISKDYLTAYNTYLVVGQEISYLQSVEMPLIVDVIDVDISPSGLTEFLLELANGTDTTPYDAYSLIDEDDIDDYVDELREGIVDIQRQTDSLSGTYEAAQTLYNYLRSGGVGALPSLFNSANAAINYEGTNSCAQRTYEQPDSFRDFLQNNRISSSLFSPHFTSTSISELDDYVCTLLDYIEDENLSDYQEAVDELTDRAQELAELFEIENQVNRTGSKLSEIQSIFQNIDLELALAREEANNDTATDVISAVNDAYIAVQNIEFVEAVINASASRGNAPLIIRFDALGSLDPSGDTITDDQISWDLDGDGRFNDGEGASVSYQYDEAGTYRVKVKILSSEDDIAAGIARATIVVEPQSSVIILKATAGGESSTLADFSTFPAIDRSNYKVTLNQASTALTFDASDSTDGDGNPLIFYEWDFGDGESTEGATESSVQHLYGVQGRYTLSLTVTDATGVEDRKYVTIYVASPAARAEASPSRGVVGESFTFSGAGSTTDLGTIVNYQWSALKDGSSVSLDETSGSSIESTFDEPGIYDVTLTVTDSGSNQDSTTIEVLVESQTPDARFDYEVPNEAEPATYIFDASDSSDPDSTDTLSYSWDFDGEEDEDYEILNSQNNGEELEVRFLTTGTRQITLTVCDNHEEELQQCDNASTEIRVDSVLDVDLEVDDSLTHRLDDNGEAKVSFSAFSATADGFEIDFGDGEDDFTDTITSGFARFTHSYDSAGVYYVTLSAFDQEGNKNSITRRVYVSAGDQPIAVINVLVNDEEVGYGETIEGNVQTKFTFDAADSVNLDGDTSGLSYSWDFGDGSTSSQRKATKTFDELITYTVTLTVRDQGDPSLNDSATIQIKLKGIDPEIKGLTVVPQGETLETPLKVKVSVDATDRDGEITYVKAWYYDVNDSATALGTLISQSTEFTLTINTKGEEGEELTYGFAAEVTDNDNRQAYSYEDLDESEVPTLTVTNGPNDSPIAQFSVDRSSVFVGDEVSFSSTSYDPDGSIVEYYWDIEGDGFFNNEAQEEPDFKHTFNQAHSEGVEVKLKVVDDAGATAVSDSVTIFVDVNSDPPEAAFLADVTDSSVQFLNNSTLDSENGAEFQGIYWDFDTDSDSDGNGIPHDDIDSLEENPEHDYGQFGTYTVSMTIVDSTGQEDSIVRDVVVIAATEPEADFTYTVDELTAEFTNRSSSDTEADVNIRSYKWDFDDDGEIDSTQKSPDFTYDDYGTYTVTLTVTDDLGQSDSIEREVDLEDPMPPLTALFASVPAANSSKQVKLESENADVTFYFNAEGGSGNYTFSFDKNIFYDTGQDGVRDNDLDYSTSEAGSWRTNFDKSWGQIVVKLTVTDQETGESDIQTLQIVFPGSLGGANLLNATSGEMIFLILSALLSAIVGISLVFRFKPDKK